jgi:hypothetical protein
MFRIHKSEKTIKLERAGYANSLARDRITAPQVVTQRNVVYESYKTDRSIFQRTNMGVGEEWQFCFITAKSQKRGWKQFLRDVPLKLRSGKQHVTSLLLSVTRGG